MVHLKTTIPMSIAATFPILLKLIVLIIQASLEQARNPHRVGYLPFPSLES
jgi:hypothetical protein